jgi:hypothetical protein
MSTRNVGWRDAGLRGFLGLTFLILSAVFQDRPFIALGIGFFALILFGTALFGVCPLYTLLRLNTTRSAKMV